MTCSKYKVEKGRGRWNTDFNSKHRKVVRDIKSSGRKIGIKI